MAQPRPEDLLLIPLFADLSNAARSALAERFEIRHFDAGASMVTEGRAGYAFFVIDEGHASVTRDGEELRTLSPGDFLGEIAIMGEGRRTATVTATEPVTAWELFGTAFRELEASQPEVAAELQQAMRERLATG